MPEIHVSEQDIINLLASGHAPDKIAKILTFRTNEPWTAKQIEKFRDTHKDSVTKRKQMLSRMKKAMPEFGLWDVPELLLSQNLILSELATKMRERLTKLVLKGDVQIRDYLLVLREQRAVQGMLTRMKSKKKDGGSKEDIRKQLEGLSIEELSEIVGDEIKV